MRASLVKSVAVSIAALTFGMALSASPAAAKPKFGFWGPGLAFGIIGAAVAADIAYSHCIEHRPIFDRWGNYIGRQTVNVCE
jgi:hypothetical protein